MASKTDKSAGTNQGHSTRASALNAVATMIDPDVFAKEYYIPSQRPELQDFFTGMFGISGPLMQSNDRKSYAKKLAQDGLIVDDVIHALAGHPYLCMAQRLSYGQLRWPSLRQILAMGGIFPQGFDYNDPSNDIKNSLTLSDYPRFGGVVPTKNVYVGALASKGDDGVFLYNAINGAEKKFTRDQVRYENGLYYSFLPAIALGEYFWKFLGMNAPETDGPISQD